MAPIFKKQPGKDPMAMGPCTAPNAESRSAGPAGESLMAPASQYKYQFDFEIGYLVNSPCKRCCQQADLPACADDCRILDSIHTVLSTSVSCNRRA